MSGDTHPRPVQVGDPLHGYCGGLFGRDHYDCGLVEAVGRDWVVVRIQGNGSQFNPVAMASGRDILTELAEYRNDFSYCDEQCLKTY